MRAPPDFPISELGRARDGAQRSRAEVLVAMHQGVLTLADVVDAASDPMRRELRRIGVAQILLHQAGWGPGRAEAVLASLRRVAMSPAAPARRLNLAWVLDPRSDGRRLAALADVLPPGDDSDGAEAAPVGFPHSRPPDAGADPHFAPEQPPARSGSRGK